MKKNEGFNYFNTFVEFCDDIIKSSEILFSTINNYERDTLEEKIAKVHLYENSSDEKLHDLRRYLIKDFLPPLDREDIASIGSRLDDIEDDIDEILINFRILNIQKIDENIKEIANLLVVAGKELKEIFLNLHSPKNYDKIREKIVDINRIESQADRLYEVLIMNLYKKDDALHILKWNKIIDCFENAIDYCERLADYIGDVLMKNS